MHGPTWTAIEEAPTFDAAGLVRAASRFREPAVVVRDGDAIGVGFGGRLGDAAGTHALVGAVPAIFPEWLGGASFCQTHGVRFAYVAGAMANGIASVELVTAMARAQMLAFFGAAGLALPQISVAIDELKRTLEPDGASFGVNLIHAPHEPALERATADLLVERGVRRVSASAFMDLTPAVVRYALAGVRQRPDGSIERVNHVFAKVSRPEVARRFMSPAPTALVEKLRSEGALSDDEARLAPYVAVAEDVTAESDSGGHTDNQPLGALFPVLLGLRDELTAAHGFTRPVRLGAAGGIGTPQAVAAAFALGADYVLTGSINQACVEAGLSEAGRQMLARTQFGDVGMAPAADMFELGVRVQVLKRGTMFASRAERLYQAYRGHEGLDAIEAEERERLERQVLGATFDDVRRACREFWSRRDPEQLEHAARDPKHEMALVFRWYLGMSSRWAIQGHPDRAVDYQIWCGPAMAAFNAWAVGSHFEEPDNRRVVDVAYNLLEGAAAVTRAQQLRSFGVPVPSAAFAFAPRRLVS